MLKETHDQEKEILGERELFEEEVLEAEAAQDKHDEAEFEDFNRTVLEEQE